jgi:hypothetical protein
MRLWLWRRSTAGSYLNLSNLYDTLVTEQLSHNTRPIYRCAHLSQGERRVIYMCGESGSRALALEPCRAIYPI